MPSNHFMENGLFIYHGGGNRMEFHEATRKDEFINKWWIEDGSGNRVGERERERGGGGREECYGACVRMAIKRLWNPSSSLLSSGQLCGPKAHLCGALQHQGGASSQQPFLTGTSFPHRSSRDDNDVQIPHLSPSAGWAEHAEKCRFFFFLKILGDFILFFCGFIFFL